MLPPAFGAYAGRQRAPSSGTLLSDRYGTLEMCASASGTSGSNVYAGWQAYLQRASEVEQESREAEQQGGGGAEPREQVHSSRSGAGVETTGAPDEKGSAMLPLAAQH